MRRPTHSDGAVLGCDVPVPGEEINDHRLALANAAVRQ